MDPDDRPSPPSRQVLFLAGIVGTATTGAILSGYLHVGRGDASARVMRSFQAAADLGEFASDPSQWTGTWVAGYFLLQGLWIRLLETSGVESFSSVVQGVLWLSTVAWALTLVGAHHAVSRAAGHEWGSLTVAALLCVPLLTELGHNAYAGIYFAALYAHALWALVSFEATGRSVWLTLAGLLFLGASTLRTEAVVAAAGIALVLAIRHGVPRAAAFFALAGSLTLGRVVLVASMPEVSGGFFQQAAQPWSVRIADLATLVLYLVVPNGIVLAILARQLGARPKRHGVVRPGLRLRLAEYAGASAVALLVFMLGGMLVFPLLGPDSRFLAVPMVGGTIALVCSATASPRMVWERMRIWLAPWVVACTVVQIFALGVDYLTDRPRPPAQVRDAAAWLRDQGPPDRPIAVDHLGWWEQTLLLHGSPSAEALARSYVHTAVPPLGPLTVRPRTPSEAAGAYLGAYRPRFLVRRGGGAARRVSEDNLWISESSFLDPWLLPLGDRLLVTPLDASGPAALATPVMENDWVQILELEWDLSLPSGTR